MTSLIWIQKPYPAGHEIYNFGRRLPCLHNYEFGFPHKCVRVQKTTFKHYMHLHYRSSSKVKPRIQGIQNL